MNAGALGGFEIMTGNADIVQAGGTEHMTHVPMGSPHCTHSKKLVTEPEYSKYDTETCFSMGLTAEKPAEESGITREEADQFSLASHRRASSAYAEDWSRPESLEMKAQAGGQQKLLDRD